MVSSCPFPRLTRNERGNTKNKSTLINDSIMLFTSFNFFQIEIGVWGKAPFIERAVEHAILLVVTMMVTTARAK